MNLIIDIGNSLAKLSVFEKGKEIYFNKSNNINIADIHNITATYKDIKNCVISSVKNTTIETEISPLFKQTVILNEETLLPVKIEYKTPETLGKDRIAAVIGAQYLYPCENILVIDAGTAITFDFIDKDGNYKGGNISPGLSMRYKALNQFTDKLPLVNYEKNAVLTGKSTNEAINSGVFFGMVYEILGYIKEYKAKYNDLTIIMTGGDANYFEEILKNSIFVVFNLNMTGLNRILEYNVVKE